MVCSNDVSNNIRFLQGDEIIREPHKYNTRGLVVLVEYQISKVFIHCHQQSLFSVSELQYLWVGASRCYFSNVCDLVPFCSKPGHDRLFNTLIRYNLHADARFWSMGYTRE